MRGLPGSDSNAMNLGVAGVALALLLVGSSIPAAGGLVLIGAGSGTASANDGSFYCSQASFTIRAVFLPGNQGIAEFEWVDIQSCAVGQEQFVGGQAAIGTLSYDLTEVPPAAWTFSCTGSESSGLDCGVMRIGPYHGPGSRNWLTKSTAFENFAGTFTQV